MESYIGGARRRVVRHRRAGAVPPQLEEWHDYLAQYRMSHPHLSYREAMQKASAGYRAQKGHSLKSEGYGAKRRASSRRVVHRRAGAEGGSILGTIGKVASVLGSLGLGRKRRVVRRKAGTRVVAGRRIAGEEGGARKRKVGRPRGTGRRIAGEEGGVRKRRVVRRKRATGRRIAGEEGGARRRVGRPRKMSRRM
jgi:hypothetical protein